MRELVAVDAAYHGFVQSAVWLGTSRSKAHNPGGESDWVEAGVTRGFGGANVYRYFTARGQPNGDFFVVALDDILVPTIGQNISVRIINCALNPAGEGCSTPWNAQTSPFETRATVNGISFTWDTTYSEPGYVAPGPGGASAAAGMESTCNTHPTAAGSTSRANTTTVRGIQYRHLNQSWANFNNLDPALFKGPAPSSIHGTDCCNGLKPGQDAECNQPVDFLFHFNSLTPKVCEP